MSQAAPSFALLATQPYPARLEMLLTARYSVQTIKVTNAGKAGEWAADGVKRLPDVLRAELPEVLLLMEGDNDLDTLGERGIRDTGAAIDSMAREARHRGIRVFLATLPPQRPGGVRAESAGLIPRFNDEVRKIAKAEGAGLVDLYNAFGNDLSLIGPDGLHPTDAGYERIAQTFHTAIVAALDVPVQTLTRGDLP